MNPFETPPQQAVRIRRRIDRDDGKMDPSGGYPWGNHESDNAVRCQTCAAPGACCKDFPLTHYFPVEATAAEVRAWVWDKHRLPFLPSSAWISAPCGWNDKGDVIKPRSSGQTVGTLWRFRCPHLGEAGRCGIYMARPRLCRVFEPERDMLCVHYQPRNAHEADAMRLKLIPETPEVTP